MPLGALYIVQPILWDPTLALLRIALRPPVRANNSPDRCPPPWKIDSRVKGEKKQSELWETS